MRTSTTYWLALSCLLAVFLTRAQNYSLHLADSLANAQQYNDAATAYERVYFFSKQPAQQIAALLARATCFKNMGRHYEAYNSLARINRFDLDDSMKCVANYQLALNLYLAGYFNDAEKYCARNYSLPVNSEEYKRSVLLHGLIYNQLNNYSTAAIKFNEYNNLLPISQNYKDSLRRFVSAAYQPKNLPKLKSLKKARRLSKCLPGAGLFYAGKPGKALANIGFQLLALGYTGANVYFANYVTAASAGLFMMRSFYTGGVNQLNEVVPKVNYRRAKKFNDAFREDYTNLLKKYHAY